MKGLEISEILLSKVVSSSDDFRIHSEFFSREFLDNELKILSYDSLPLSNYAKVSDGDHSKFPENQNQEIRYLQARDINNYFLEISSSAFVSEEYFIKNKRSAIKSEDILLSIMGTVGDITITPQNFEVAMCNRALAIIKNVKGIIPQYLFAYLTSKFATLEIERLKNGGVQQRINLDVLSKVRIPSPSKDFQQKIKTAIIRSQDIRQKSKSLYKEAETLLLQEIGLKDFEPSKEGINVKSLKDSFLSSGRLDAEYYQPKYEDIETQMRRNSNNVVLINDVLKKNLRSGSTPKEFFTESGDINFVRVEAFGSEMTFNDRNCFSVSEETFKKTSLNRVTKDDILVSMTGTIGKVAIYNSLRKGLINQNIVKLTVDKNIVLVNYLALYISSVGTIFLKKIQTGNVQPYVNVPNFSTLIVPIIDYQIQTQIADLVESSFSLKSKSEQLLESAKKAVEMAIEQDEETALQWIEKQLIDLEG